MFVLLRTIYVVLLNSHAGFTSLHLILFYFLSPLFLFFKWQPSLPQNVITSARYTISSSSPFITYQLINFSLSPLSVRLSVLWVQVLDAAHPHDGAGGGIPKGRGPGYLPVHHGVEERQGVVIRWETRSRDEMRDNLKRYGDMAWHWMGREGMG